MDPITHAIIGATVARATTPDRAGQTPLPVRTRTWIGGVAAAFPDIDYVTLLIDPLSYISDWHRAETHSVILLPLWALLLGLLIATAIRRRAQWREITLICGLAIASHILSDLTTSWGTQIFAPLSDYRPSLGTTFIIDPFFTLIILTGLIISTVRNSRIAAQTAITTLITYVAIQALLKNQVYEIAESQLILNRWQQAKIFTMPQPVSPFNWKIIVSEGEQYHVAYLDLLANDEKPLPTTTSPSFLNILSHYRPESQLRWSHYSRFGDDDRREMVKSAWLQPEFERYRRFAIFPAFVNIERRPNRVCVAFTDLRFSIPLLAPTFNYAVCRATNNSKSWTVRRMERL